MQNNPSLILETSRLILREFSLEDGQFIRELLNSPNWLKFIGDRNIHSQQDALDYLVNGPLKSYQEFGFGLWRVEDKQSQLPIGMCGLLKRENLEDVDIGFAFLPEFTKMGYAYEIASATINYAKENLKLKRIVAITDPENSASIKLLHKIGLYYEGPILSKTKEKLMLFSSKT